MKQEWSRVLSALMAKCPFVASILFKTKVVTVPRFPPPYDLSPAGVNAQGVLVLAEEVWGELGLRERASAVAHEAVHLSLLHPQRRGEREPRRWNVAADAVANKAVQELSLPLPEGCIRGEKLGVEGWERMSTEELYERLPKLPPLPAAWDLLPGGTAEGGTVIQEGSPSLYDPSLPKEERERLWKEAVASALMAQKAAGTLPAGLERLWDEVLKPRTDVRGLFRQAIRWGLGRTVSSTWVRTSRKNPELPGVRRMALPNLWALVDTSGSIGPRELGLFVGTVLEFSGQTTVNVVCWDGEAYEPVRLRGRDLGPLREKMRGGGGTTIRPALRKTLEQMKPLDIVAVLTDGHVYDWEEASGLLDEVARKASSAVLLWTEKELRHPRWRCLRLAFWG